MATVDLTTKFLPRVDEQFTAESKRSLVTNQDFTWDGAATVRVYKVSTGKMNDYARNGDPATGSRFGEVEQLNATTYPLTIEKDRSFTFVIDKLDEDDFIEDSYILEVSSPGLGRPLKKERDFERSLGEEVEIRLYKALNKQKEFTGILKAYDKETVTIETAEGELVFNRPDIALIRLAFDF